MATVDILVPTNNRLASLVMTLSGIAAQQLSDLHVIIADQSRVAVENEREVRSLWRIIEARGGQVSYHHREHTHGVAEQRNFLLQQAGSDAILYLDDDVWMEPWVVERLLRVLQEERCGFVGAFPSALVYRDDVRPHQHHIEFWDGPVHPEEILPGSPRWQNPIHRAANVYHAGLKLPPGTTRLYKIAWCGACVLYDRARLLSVGGFSFWSRLPRYHSGEDVLVQNLLMRRWGGCCILPAGTYFSEAPTTVMNTEGTVDGHALALLSEMIARYAPESAREVDAQSL